MLSCLVRCYLAAQLGVGIGTFAAAQGDATASHVQWSARRPDLTHMTLAGLRTRLSDLENTKGKQDPDLVPVLLAIAKSYREQGAYVTGLPFARRALEIARKVHGEYDVDVVLSLDLLGTLDLLAGDNKAAIENDQTARSLVKKYLGTGPAIQAVLLLHLGMAYLAGGRLEQAEAALKRARRALADTSGPDTPEATAAQKSLGELYLKRGEYAKAEKELIHVFAIHEEELSQSLDDAGEALARLNMAQVQIPLGALYTAVGRYDEASHWLLGALQCYEAQLGKNHPALEDVLVNLAALAQAQGNQAAADEYQKRAESIHEACLGIAHLAGVPLPQPLTPVTAQRAKH
jgi:tetratricopeptide (TPR) repeat protein